MYTNAKLSEVLNVAAPGQWVSAARFERFLAVSFDKATEGSPDSVVVTLRKATDAAGSGAVDWVVGTSILPGTSPHADDLVYAHADGKAADLGLDPNGVQYAYVSASVTGGSTSPANVQGLLIMGDARFSTDCLAKYVPS